MRMYKTMDIRGSSKVGKEPTSSGWLCKVVLARRCWRQTGGNGDQEDPHGHGKPGHDRIRV